MEILTFCAKYDKIKSVMSGNKAIIGAFEKIKISKIAGQDIKNPPELTAKIDTGAFSGVIHAENIQEKDGILSFDLLGEEKIHLETTDFEERIVKNTHGGKKSRYLARFTILFDDQEFETLLGIDDRRKMKFNMLIGRAFLNKNQILVDVSRSLELDKEWKKMGEKQ